MTIAMKMFLLFFSFLKKNPKSQINAMPLYV